MVMRMASQMVVRLISVMVGMVMLSLPAHADCGPKITLDADTYDRSDRSWGDNRENKFGLTLSWNLGNDYCEEQAFTEWQESREDLKDQEIRNIERLLRLCEKYGEDHKLLKGKCK